MSAPGIPYLSPPSRIVNEALDSLGTPGLIIGALEDGTDISEVSRRNYGQVLRQLLASAHWGFARRRAQLTLLGDATLQSPPQISTYVEGGWAYAYAWPIDAVHGIWLPVTYPFGSPTIGAGGVQPQPPTYPFVSGGPAPGGQASLVQAPQWPGRFLVSSSDQYPIEVGTLPWNQLPDLQRTSGVGPNWRKVILTNNCNACFVYTRLSVVIEEWDPLFRQAMVALMALTVLPVAITDPKLRVAERDRHIGIAKNAIADARVAMANEAGFPQTVTTTPPWLTARNNRGYGYAGVGAAPGLDGTLGTYYGCWETFSYGGGVY